MEGYYKRIIRVLHVKVRNAPILIVAPQRRNQLAQNMRALAILRKKKIRVIAQAEYAPMKSAVHKIPNPRAHMIILLALLIMKMFLRSIQPRVIVIHANNLSVVSLRPYHANGVRGAIVLRQTRVDAA